MAQQGKKRKKRSWWIDLPVAGGLVAAVLVYSRHLPSYDQGRALVAVAIGTFVAIIGLKLIDVSVGRSRRKSQPRPQRRGYGYRGASDR